MEVMDGKPDLIIGNYTDGNLVASLMASKLDTTLVPTFGQCSEFFYLFSYQN